MRGYTMLAGCAATALAAGLSASAHAQALPATAAPPAGAAAPGTASADPAAADDAGEIVVTAQRRSERLVDVPVSVTALSAERLREADIKNVGDLPRLTPSLRIDTRAGFIQPSIRGVGTSLSIPGTGSNVATYVDGFYVQSPLPTDFALPNISGIQVLKGPQGTLFGRNSTGGAILIDTLQPSREASASVEAGYGTHNSQRYLGYVTFGLDERTAIDVAGVRYKGRGTLRNIVTGSHKDGAYDRWSVRAGIKSQLTDNFSLTFHYAHADVDDPNSSLGGAYTDPKTGQPVASRAGVAGTGVIATRPNTTATTEPFFTSRIKSDVFQFAAELDLDSFMVKSYTQWRNVDTIGDYDADITSSTASLFRIAYDEHVFTQELLATSKPGGALQWTAGLFYFHSPLDYQPLLFTKPATLPTTFILPVNRTTFETSTYAAFGDVTYEVSDRLFVTGGVRFSKDKVTRPFFQNLLPLQPAVTPDKINDNRIDPRVVIRYKPTDESSIYFNYSKAHKAAIAATQPTGANDDIKAEKIDSFEIGGKYATRGFSLDASAFYLLYKDLQLSSALPNGNPLASVIVVRNAARVNVKGVELAARYDVTPQFQLTASGAYIDAPYKEFPNSVRFVQTTPATTPPTTRPYAALLYDAKGKQVLRTPKFTGTVGARYRVDDVLGGRLTLAGQLYYTSKVYFDIGDQFYQKGYALANARVEWRDAADRFSVSVFADNLTNKDYYSSVTVQSGGASAFWGEKRTVGASVGANALATPPAWR